jgi:hypothetical protein
LRQTLARIDEKELSCPVKMCLERNNDEKTDSICQHRV